MSSDKIKKTGVELIAEERRRQIEDLGYSVESDEEDNKFNQLALAAACYALPPSDRRRFGVTRPKSARFIWPFRWPVPEPACSQEQRVRELVKAGALIAAEIDRWLR